MSMQVKATVHDGGGYVSLGLIFGGVTVICTLTEEEARNISTGREQPGPCGWLVLPNGQPSLSLPHVDVQVMLGQEDAGKIVQAIKDEMLLQDVAALDMTHPADGSGITTLADARRRWEELNKEE
jgi:hypothetical protein